VRKIAVRVADYFLYFFVLFRNFDNYFSGTSRRNLGEKVQFLIES